MHSNQLPTILEITGLHANSNLIDWQTAVNAYLTHQSSNTNAIFWYNTDLTGLTTETAREIATAASYGNLDTPQHHVILAAETTNQTAQNALLKTLEEPPLGFHLVLVVRRLSTVLPTIISRCQYIRWQNTHVATQPLPNEASLITKALNPATTHGELVSCVQNYKNRSDAIALVEAELALLDQSKMQVSADVMRVTLQCWQALQQNANLTLTLENWLLSVHSSSSSTR